MTALHHDVTRYPLTWPAGKPRCTVRKYAPFYSRKTMDNGYHRKEALTVGVALKRLSDEVRLLGIHDAIISSNLRQNLDGSISAGKAKILPDPGVAVYFKVAGKPRVLACDKWISAAENMAAIAGHIAAIRAQDRYGVGTLEEAFAGYAALPEKATASDWAMVLKVSAAATRDEVLAAHREPRSSTSSL